MSAGEGRENVLSKAEVGAVEKRRHPRTRKYGPQELTITRSSAGGAEQTVRAVLWDFSEGGLGMDSQRALSMGEIVKIVGNLRSSYYSMAMQARARIVYCRRIDKELYRVGVAFLDVTYRRLDSEEE